MNTNDFIEFMNQNNYKYDKIDSRSDSISNVLSFYKRCDTEYYCECNKKAPNYGVTYFSIHTPSGVNSVSIEIEIVVESKENDWYVFKIYSIPLDKFVQNVESFEQKVLKLWNAVNQHNQHNQLNQ